MATENWTAGDDEWELVNDDGFVYKRKKRCQITAAAPSQPDPAVEAKNRLIRKKNTLVKIKEKYEREIENWEKLSKMLKEMEVQQAETLICTDVVREVDSVAQPLDDSNVHLLVDKLLAQADAQEAVIRNVSNLCDIADALCTAEEERLKESLIDLPIWDPSPTDIFTSLCKQ